MAHNFLLCDRDQALLLPPSLREWLPEEHLAWFVRESVAELDLEAFYAPYRSDGWGAAAHDPQMTVAARPGVNAARTARFRFEANAIVR